MGSIISKCREMEDDLKEDIARIEALPITQQDQQRLQELKLKLKSFNPIQPLPMTKSILGGGF